LKFLQQEIDKLYADNMTSKEVIQKVLKLKDELSVYLQNITQDVPELEDHELFLVGKVANGNLENRINSIDVCLAL
jgi:ACT domain-containing protein